MPAGSSRRTSSSLFRADTSAATFNLMQHSTIKDQAANPPPDHSTLLTSPIPHFQALRRFHASPPPHQSAIISFQFIADHCSPEAMRPDPLCDARLQTTEDLITLMPGYPVLIPLFPDVFETTLSYVRHVRSALRSDQYFFDDYPAPPLLTSSSAAETMGPAVCKKTPYLSYNTSYTYATYTCGPSDGVISHKRSLGRNHQLLRHDANYQQQWIRRVRCWRSL